MTSWNFKAERSIEDMSKILESALGSVRGFAFYMNRNSKHSITFKLRKRILYGWYMIFHNWTVVQGKISKTNSETQSSVEISFTQHFLILFILFTHVVIAMFLLIASFSGENSKSYYYIPGAILLVLGLILWIAIQKKFDKDIENYKTLISDILEL